VQRDTNHDGRPDVWEIYEEGHLRRMGWDLDFDGRVDRWDRDEIAERAAMEKEMQQAGEAKQKEAEKAGAGADFVGADDVIEKIKGGWIDYDAVVATPDMMKEVGKLGPVLGKKGLMPKPKAGTVTDDIKGIVKELKGGRIEYKADKTGVVHIGLGKSSFEATAIAENIKTFFNQVVKDKPSDAKGNYIKSMHISLTMGPGIKINHKGIER
jgi:large subunit ribosomal protein L1